MKRFFWYPAGLVLMLFSSSCMTQWQMEASFDLAKNGEKGPSGETSEYAPTWNLVNEWLDDELGWMWDDNVDQGYLPSDYVTHKTGGGLGLVTGAGFVQKGGKSPNGGGTQHLNYLEVREDVAYMRKSAAGLFYAGLGPYIAYGAGGNVHAGGVREPVFGSDGYKRFDAGLHLTSGFRMASGVSFGIGYEWGVYDKSRNPSDYTSRNRTFSLNVGYSVDKIVGAFRKK